MKGTIIFAGLGLHPGQCTCETLEAIGQADIVFAQAGEQAMFDWLKTLHPDVRTLQDHYARHASRPEAYRAMAETTLGPARAGKRVCVAYYGHPGVFVSPSHIAFAQARREGIAALMLPGVSAEDCLFADLGVDPGVHGLQTYEARDFFVHARRIDPSAALVLWQLAVVDEAALQGFSSRAGALDALAQALGEVYPLTHRGVLYEAAVEPHRPPRKESIALKHLGRAIIAQETTLYVPPAEPPRLAASRLDLMRRMVAARAKSALD